MIENSHEYWILVINKQCELVTVQKLPTHSEYRRLINDDGYSERNRGFSDKYAHDIMLTANFDWNYIEVDKFPLVNLHYFIKPSQLATDAGYNIKKFVEVNRYKHAWFKVWHFTGQKVCEEKGLFNLKTLMKYPG